MPPHGQDILGNKENATANLPFDISQILATHNVPVWVAKEYKPAGRTWNAHETASGLQRIYRLLLQEDRQIPPTLIRDISLLPSRF